MLRSRLTLATMVAVGLVLLVACKPAAEEAPAVTKAAILFEGPLADTGWNTSSWAAMQRLSESYGWEIIYTDNVETVDMEDLMRGYAENGYDVIFGPGWLFGDAMIALSAEFPETTFVHINEATTAGDNFSSNGWVSGEVMYFAGRIAGEMTQTGKIAYLFGTESPVATYEFTVYEEAAQEVNPDVEATVGYVGSWTDPATAKELAQAQIEAGVDVILSGSGHGDFGVFEAIEEAKAAGTTVMFIGFTGDMCQYLPDLTLASIVQLPGDLVQIAGDEFQAGTLMPGHSVYGMKDGAQHLAWCGTNVPAELQAEIDQMMQDYLDGTLEVPVRTDL